MCGITALTNGLVYLTVCAVRGTVPSAEFMKTVDLEKLYSRAEQNKLSAVVCTALDAFYKTDDGRKLFGGENAKIYKKFTEEKLKTIRRNALFDFACGELEKTLTEKKIWYLPVKGKALGCLYPGGNTRFSGDRDYLFNPDFRAEVRSLFESRGYTVCSYGADNHDVYEKKPVLNFEMHVELFSGLTSRVWREYYSNVKSRLLQADGNPYALSFSPEDCYVYYIAHFCKHNDLTGTGLRTLTDVYVFLDKFGDGLNENYVKAQLKTLGLDGYEAVLRPLALKIFSGEKNFELTENERQMLEQTLSVGVYGSKEQLLDRKLKKLQRDNLPITNKTKKQYIMRRIFPPIEFYERFYPFAYRHRVLLPAAAVYRLLRGAFAGKRRKKAAEEMKRIFKDENKAK